MLKIVALLLGLSAIYAQEAPQSFSPTLALDDATAATLGWQRDAACASGWAMPRQQQWGAAGLAAPAVAPVAAAPAWGASWLDSGNWFGGAGYAGYGAAPNFFWKKQKDDPIDDDYQGFDDEEFYGGAGENEYDFEGDDFGVEGDEYQLEDLSDDELPEQAPAAPAGDLQCVDLGAGIGFGAAIPAVPASAVPQIADTEAAARAEQALLPGQNNWWGGLGATNNWAAAPYGGLYGASPYAAPYAAPAYAGLGAYGGLGGYGWGGLGHYGAAGLGGYGAFPYLKKK